MGKETSYSNQSSPQTTPRVSLHKCRSPVSPLKQSLTSGIERMKTDSCKMSKISEEKENSVGSLCVSGGFGSNRSSQTNSKSHFNQLKIHVERTPVRVTYPLTEKRCVADQPADLDFSACQSRAIRDLQLISEVESPLEASSAALIKLNSTTTNVQQTIIVADEDSGDVIQTDSEESPHRQMGDCLTPP